LDFDAIIFDFDGVLLESEYEGNRHLAELLTEIGHPTSVEQALKSYTGLSGRDFIAAIEANIGRELPVAFHHRRGAEDERVLREGLPAIAGAVEFVRSLPTGLPVAVASSSTKDWVRTHLDHLGLSEIFKDCVFSGREDVARGKPAPDLYLHAAEQLGVDISRTVVLEDSEVGAKGALVSGARVIGLVAGEHCLPGHADLLRDLGVHEIACDFDDIRRLLNL
jgi:HAD superfamily hydrolase (TIGR01509 family)